MAGKTIKLKITGFDEETFKDRTIVTVQFDDGQEDKPTWKKSYAIPNDRAISLEKFISDIKEKHITGEIKIERPTNAVHYLKEAKDRVIELNLEEEKKDGSS